MSTDDSTDTRVPAFATLTHTVSSTDYRDAIGRFMTGVTVVSTRHAGAAHGITASAVASVTLEPPTVLICLNRHSATGHAVLESGHFILNILNDSQQALAKHFASKIEDKFADVPHEDGLLGDPLITPALAHLECRVSGHSDVGSHHVFFGEVIKVHTAEGAPLAYYRGRFIPPQD
jgi:flavin reductase (DIM6/NTAB) family NADH-FMN oxidoreductase RutF